MTSEFHKLADLAFCDIERTLRSAKESDMPSNDGDGNPGALSFWAERGDSAGDRAWRAWRRDLGALIGFLDERRAASAADEARLVAMKAEADTQVAEAEARVAEAEV